MTIINYPGNSPYAATPQQSWRIDRFVFRPVPPNAADQPYTLSSRHLYRPDKLSYELYNTPAYWWIFAARNPFLRADPVWGFVPGLEIMVSSGDYLSRILGT